VACNFDKAEALMVAAGAAGVPIASVGRFTGDTVRFGAATAPLAELAAIYRTGFADALA
jgi:phosphoribosylformylglycinamidine synthase